MAITCVIRYQIDPRQREGFKTYAENWGRIIPRCGGHLVDVHRSQLALGDGLAISTPMTHP